MVEDSDIGCLFVIDNLKVKIILVLDIYSGKLFKQFDVGDLLVVQFNKKCYEIYILQCEFGKVISFDVSCYMLKKSWVLLVNFNSLLFFVDGQMLFVIVKQFFNKDYFIKGLDSVVCIDLNV